MNYTDCIKKLDEKVNNADKFFCQYLLFDQSDDKLSLYSMFNKLKYPNNDRESFFSILRAMNFLGIKVYHYLICSLQILNNFAYHIKDAKKKFLIELYKECINTECDYLLSNVFNIKCDRNLPYPQNFFTNLSNFHNQPWNKKLENDLMKFSQNYKLPRVKQLITDCRDLFIEDNLIPATASSAIQLSRYEIYEDRTNYCLVYNTYDVVGELPREGSEHDVNIIWETFDSIRGFQSMIEEIQTKDYFFTTIRSYLSQCMNSDMVVAFFMSHGDSESILAANGEKIKILEILDLFLVRNAIYLANKPKLLIFQACRGSGENIIIKTDTSPIQTDNVRDRNLIKCSPDLSDYYMYFPTSIGYAANRSKETGSEFIQLLCKTIENNYLKASWNQITLIVNGSNIYNNGHSAQIPEYQGNLRKELYFDFPQ